MDNTEGGGFFYETIIVTDEETPSLSLVNYNWQSNSDIRLYIVTNGKKYTFVIPEKCLTDNAYGGGNDTYVYECYQLIHMLYKANNQFPMNCKFYFNNKPKNYLDSLYCFIDQALVYKYEGFIADEILDIEQEQKHKRMYINNIKEYLNAKLYYNTTRRINSDMDLIIYLKWFFNLTEFATNCLICYYRYIEQNKKKVLVKGEKRTGFIFGRKNISENYHDIFRELGINKQAKSEKYKHELLTQEQLDFTNNFYVLYSIYCIGYNRANRLYSFLVRKYDEYKKEYNTGVLFNNSDNTDTILGKQIAFEEFVKNNINGDIDEKNLREKFYEDTINSPEFRECIHRFFVNPTLPTLSSSGGKKKTYTITIHGRKYTQYIKMNKSFHKVSDVVKQSKTNVVVHRLAKKN